MSRRIRNRWLIYLLVPHPYSNTTATASFNHLNPLAQSSFISLMWQDQRARKINSLMNLELLSSSALTFHQVLSLYLLSEDTKPSFNSKVPSSVTSLQLKQHLFISSTYGSVLFCNWPEFSTGALSYFMRENAPSACPPTPPCLFLEKYNLVHLHFSIWTAAKKPYENDRTAKKNDDFIA